jgi:hypothetical protein
MPAAGERPDHWDLMLQHDDVLWTWALDCDPHQAQPAKRLPDHRVAYLDYEGPISGDRGRVSRWDAGEYAVESRNDDRLVLRLCGGRLNGQLRLGRVADERWEYEFTRDASTQTH